jgi:putative transcriptional regulator
VKPKKPKYMSDAMFSRLADGVGEMNAVMSGAAKPYRVHRLEAVDVLAVREKLKLSRVEFSNILGVSPRTLESWEQGKRRPSGAANALLRVAVKNPRAVLEALR